MITALFDESWTGIDSRLILVTIRERLVVAAFPAYEVQGVAQFPGAQFLHPNMRLRVALSFGSIQGTQGNQRDQKHRSSHCTAASHHLDIFLVSRVDRQSKSWMKRRTRSVFSSPDSREISQ